MSPNKVIQTWKDAHYRAQLSESERAELPENPAGGTRLTDEQLSPIVGGMDVNRPHTWFGSRRFDCCKYLSTRGAGDSGSTLF